MACRKKRCRERQFCTPGYPPNKWHEYGGVMTGIGGRHASTCQSVFESQLVDCQIYTLLDMSGFIGQKSASFTGWTKLDHVRQRWTMFDVVRPSSHYLDQVRPSWNTFCHVRPPWITLDDIGPLSITTIHHFTRRRVSERFSFSSSLDHIRPGSVSLDHVRPCWTSLDTSIRCNRFF